MSTVRMPEPAPEKDTPARIAASVVKQRGWRGVMKTVREEGAVVVTNHNEPEAVILGVERYRQLLEAARAHEQRADSDLETLRLRFDERLSILHGNEAGDRMRASMRAPVKLRGKVKAGSGF